MEREILEPCPSCGQEPCVCGETTEETPTE